MKKLITLLFIGTLFVVSPTSINAQVQVSVNINQMPQWGPVGFNRVEYYYFPEAGIYYYAPKAQFIYLQRGKWIFSSRLPYQYRNLDLYSTYKVVINKPKPYLQHNYYVSHYKGYKNYHSKQATIRDSKGQRNGNVNRGNEGNRVKNNPGNDHGNKIGNKPQGNKFDKNAKGNKGQDNRDNKGNNNDHR